jgi:hypothetical protein
MCACDIVRRLPIGAMWYCTGTSLDVHWSHCVIVSGTTGLELVLPSCVHTAHVLEPASAPKCRRYSGTRGMPVTFHNSVVGGILKNSN